MCSHLLATLSCTLVTNVMGESCLLQIFFTQDVKLKLLEDADKYKGKVNEAACLMAYKTLVSAHNRKIQHKIELSTLVYEARRAHEALSKLSERREK